MPRIVSLLAILSAAVIGLLGQAPPATQVIGEITAIDAASKTISLKTDKGEMVTIGTADNTFFRKVPPGATDMSKAARIQFSDVTKGDRIAAIGQKTEDKIQARTVLVMAASEIKQRQQQEQADWQKRGTSGIVTAVDAAGFTIKSGANTITVQPSEKTDFKRYSADSVKFADAVPSSLGDIKVGDQARVLGDKDGTSVKAERVVVGSFRQIAATISAVNPESSELTIKDLASRKTLTVRVNAESTMRKLPPQMATALARRFGAAGRGEAPEGRGAAPEGRGGFGGRSGAAGDIGQALDRLPAMPLSELKAGDAIMLSSTTGSDPSRVTAVMLLAGVEPLLTAAPNATRDILGGWNLGAGGGEGGDQ